MSEEIKNELTVGEAGVPEQDPAPVAPADAAAANGDAFAAETKRLRELLENGKKMEEEA